jgi:hypothetical protein
VRKRTPSAGIGGALSYMLVVVAAVPVNGETGSGLIGSGLNGSVAGVPIPPEVVVVEVVVLVIEVVVPLDDVMPGTVDVGLMVVVVDIEPEFAGIDVPAGLVEVEVDVGVGAEVNVRERLIPAGTCETLTVELIAVVEPDRPGIIDPVVIAPAEADPVDAVAEAGESPLTRLTIMEAGGWAPCCALASTVKSLRRAATLIPLRSSWTKCVNWALVGVVWRIDSNSLVTFLPALVSAGLEATSAG